MKALENFWKIFTLISLFDMFDSRRSSTEEHSVVGVEESETGHSWVEASEIVMISENLDKNKLTLRAILLVFE